MHQSPHAIIHSGSQLILFTTLCSID